MWSLLKGFLTSSVVRLNVCSSSCGGWLSSLVCNSMLKTRHRIHSAYPVGCFTGCKFVHYFFYWVIAWPPANIHFITKTSFNLFLRRPALSFWWLERSFMPTWVLLCPPFWGQHCFFSAFSGPMMLPTASDSLWNCNGFVFVKTILGCWGCTLWPDSHLWFVQCFTDLFAGNSISDVCSELCRWRRAVT